MHESYIIFFQISNQKILSNNLLIKNPLQSKEKVQI